MTMLFQKKLFAVALAAFCQGALALDGSDLRDAPNFTLPAGDNTNVRLIEFRGKAVLLNFWSSWCGSCRVETLELRKLQRQFQAEGVQVLGVSIDESPDNAMETLGDANPGYPILFDMHQRIAGVYGVARLPTTVFIDASGRVRYVHKGYRKGDEKTYAAIVREILKP